MLAGKMGGLVDNTKPGLRISHPALGSVVEMVWEERPLAAAGNVIFLGNG
jgi:hypothetical protein